VLPDVQATLKPVSKSKDFRDQLAPSQEKAVAIVPVTRSDADIVYGAFWYRDIWKEGHYFRFILSIGKNSRTRPDVVGMDVRYWDWS
jgi:hypothetical protein